MDVWQLLADRFPFNAELAEVPEINRRFGLSGEVSFSAALRPSFFVGDISGEADILLIGLKPGLSSDSSIAFAHEREALLGSFDAYRRSRTNYFLSAGLNTQHYWPTAKAAATMRGDPFPTRVGEYLHKYVVQAELVPFFAPHAGLDKRGFKRLHEESRGGQLAHDVIEALLGAHEWKAVLVRYKLGYDTFCATRGLEPKSGRTEITVNGRSVPVVGLIGQYLSDADILALRDGEPTGIRAIRPRESQARLELGSRSFEELREFVLSLGADVQPLARRSNGTFVFRRGRNFVTLIPQVRSLKIDVFGGEGWDEGIRVEPSGIGLAEAKRLIRRAYEFAE